MPKINSCLASAPRRVPRAACRIIPRTCRICTSICRNHLMTWVAIVVACMITGDRRLSCLPTTRVVVRGGAWWMSGFLVSTPRAESYIRQTCRIVPLLDFLLCSFLPPPVRPSVRPSRDSKTRHMFDGWWIFGVRRAVFSGRILDFGSRCSTDPGVFGAHVLMPCRSRPL